ncbi:methylmalonyl-CoA mutase, large subunit [Thermobaculum terrenum ATCC BAA-798]|uniref:Methylmalonyl-CoA mutase, large subunit n=1 Tax=Thermobaculum terrenum (strain ATCC BAA-798 / CCMEE 7001 / YNP1) TaxID=525904 RepID=D1CCR3_THET1|nr:methylmalonyl-CoA mutase family protein [Thermobaculum terrenum]ACZ42578.1 methylmalonyl-CoA mutase, large subunit [Thermobaculum terrenum ATCC BAA-798]
MKVEDGSTYPVDDLQHQADLEEAYKHWLEKTLPESIRRIPERKEHFTSLSGIPIKTIYTPLDTKDIPYNQALGLPGEFPYTRGIHPTMYRSKLWTMRMFAGYGTAEETNRRFHYLLRNGQTGLSIAFDLPTLYGYDTDHPLAEGEFGKCGVAVSSRRDMEILLQGLPLDKVSVSMTINGPAAIIWAMFIAAAERFGYHRSQLRGTLQNDILKEYIAQKEFIFPPEPSMRLVTDTIEFGMKEMPQWNTISISGYHIREAGSTAIQELAFTLSDGFTYVEHALARGLKIDDFAPRLSFFFNSHNDLFEEIAKFRSARRIWAYELRDRYGAKDPRSWRLRFHAQTAGCSLTAQQPENNIVRTTLQALAAVLGGAQSIHTNSLDEALTLPSELAAKIALRTQQIIAEESGVTNTVDPLGGSYFLETLTNEIESSAREYIQKIRDMGGMIEAIKVGFPQREIAESAYRYNQELESGERRIVGVNAYQDDDYSWQPPILEIDPRGEQLQRERLKEIRSSRDKKAWQESLDRLRKAAKTGENLMPPLIDAANADATLGEITDVLRDVFGTYSEQVII